MVLYRQVTIFLIKLSQWTNLEPISSHINQPRSQTDSFLNWFLSVASFGWQASIKLSALDFGTFFMKLSTVWGHKGNPIAQKYGFRNDLSPYFYLKLVFLVTSFFFRHKQWLVLLSRFVFKINRDLNQIRCVRGCFKNKSLWLQKS